MSLDLKKHVDVIIDIPINKDYICRNYILKFVMEKFLDFKMDNIRTLVS